MRNETIQIIFIIVFLSLCLVFSYKAFELYVEMKFEDLSKNIRNKQCNAACEICDCK